MSRQRYIIGIGSQRAGSTLLHRLLDASTPAFMHPLKELHYFDTLHGVRSPEALQDYCRRQLRREADRRVKAGDRHAIDHHSHCYLRACRRLAFGDLAQVEYRDLFRPFLCSHALLGEVTPEYMLLDPQAISAMRAVVGDDAAVILLCRKPVERILSAVKLMNAYNNLRMDDAQARDWLTRMLDGNSNWIAAQDAYNDYETAIANYSSAFSSFVALRYETLVSNPEHAAVMIQEATGIAVDAGAFRAGAGTMANELGGGFDIGTELRSRLVERYRRQAEFLERHFPGAT